MPEHIAQILKTLGSLPSRDEFEKKFENILTLLTKAVASLDKKVDAKLKGLDGHTPTEHELLSLIRPLIPKLRQPEDGHTPTDEELTRLIKPLIPDVRDGIDADEDAIVKRIEERYPKVARHLRDILETLEEGEKLSISAIENLREELDALKRRSSGGTSVTRGKEVKIYDLSDQLDGVTKTFNLPAFYRVFDVKLWSAPALRPTTDYTTNGSDFRLTFTDEIPADTLLAAGQTCLVLYQEP